MGERKLFKKSFSFPHTPNFQKLSNKIIFWIYIVRSNFISVCHPERSVAKSNFCEVQRSKRAKAQGEAAAGSIMNFCYLSKTNVTFISKKDSKTCFEIPSSLLLLGLLRSFHSTTQTSTPLRFAQDDTLIT